MALDHVPTDAVSAAFGKLLLEIIPIRNLRVDMSKRVSLPADDNGYIDFPKLTDTQVITVIVMSLAQHSVGWYSGFDEEDTDAIVTFLTGLGVTDPKSVIEDAAKAYESANPKPKKPRKPSTKKKAAKKPAKTSSAAAKPTPANVLGK